MKNIQELKKTKEKAIALVRVDLNIEDADIKNSLRIDRSVKTLSYLLGKGYRIILLSHRGNPKKQDKKLSLRSFAKIFSKKLHSDVLFIPYMPISLASAYVRTHHASVCVLENLRFFRGEDENDVVFAKKLSDLGAIYVNDAFASCDRKRASTCAITKYILSYAGFSLQEEVRMLSDARKTIKKPFTLILGGAKTADKMPLIRSFYKKADNILIGGGVANTWFFAMGIPVGESLYDDVKAAMHLQKYIKKIIYPCDVVMRDGKIFDVGPRTANAYANIIKHSSYVVWGGPLGNTDEREFWGGSKKIFDAICTSRARVIIGGGETTSFILKQHTKIPPNVFLSTGGGAMLAYLSGKKLPGIEALS